MFDEGITYYGRFCLADFGGGKTKVVMEKKGTVQGKGKRGRERKGKTGEEEKKRLKTE